MGAWNVPNNWTAIHFLSKKHEYGFASFMHHDDSSKTDTQLTFHLGKYSLHEMVMDGDQPLQQDHMWITQVPSYQMWLDTTSSPLSWVILSDLELVSKSSIRLFKDLEVFLSVLLLEAMPWPLWPSPDLCSLLSSHHQFPDIHPHTTSFPKRDHAHCCWWWAQHSFLPASFCFE